MSKSSKSEVVVYEISKAEKIKDSVLVFILPILQSLHLIGFLAFFVSYNYAPHLFKLDLSVIPYVVVGSLAFFSLVILFQVLASLAILRIPFLQTHLGDWWRRTIQHYSRVQDGMMKMGIKVNNIFVAGFEDVIFLVPVLLTPEGYKTHALVISSILFALVHPYKGPFGQLLTIGLLVFVFYPIASNYGIMTSILSHAIWDIVAFKLMYFLKDMSDKKQRALAKKNGTAPPEWGTAAFAKQEIEMLKKRKENCKEQINAWEERYEKALKQELENTPGTSQWYYKNGMM